MSDNQYPLLTIGCATFREPQLWATLQSLHANHPRDKVTYLVIDNAPEPDGKGANTVRAMGGDYYHRPDLWGTSAPRDAVMRLAKTPWVMVIDAHVILETGAVEALLDYIKAHPQSNDMIVGPMIGDNGSSIFTHWRPEESARPGLWGVWDTAWQAPDGTAFCVWPSDPAKGRMSVSFRDLVGNEIPPVKGVNPHDPAKSGCVLGGHSSYEIHSQGLGLFAMRREAWPGFHPLNRGFGGEEGIVHEMIRRQGGKVLLLSKLRWRHCFRYHGGGVEKQEPTPYRLKIYDHVWNLLIGHRALGIDCTKQIFEHFGKNIPPVDQLPEHEKQFSWDSLVKESERVQAMGTGWQRKARLNLLSVWYTNNGAPLKVMQASLRSIEAARQQTMHHDIAVITSTWEPIPDNPFRLNCFIGRPPQEIKPGHQSIIWQIRKGIECWKNVNWTVASTEMQAPPRWFAKGWDAICFLEHDVLYSPGYFDRIGDAFLSAMDKSGQLAPVVSHLDYIGLNGTGWLGVKERHEPMHQLAVRRDIALANLDRAEQDARREGACLLEPDSFHPCRRTTENGPLAVDFDGTASIGVFPVFQPFVIITGRHDDDLEPVRKMFPGVSAIYARPKRPEYPTTDEGVARHKADVITRLGVVEFWEDNERQASLIRAWCKGVIVHHVQGQPKPPDRSHWVRIPPMGLCPSVHINW